MEFDLNNYEKSVKQMKKYGSSKYPFFGKNEDGENTVISVNPDNITIETFQHNGWIRTNVLWIDGTMDETFTK